MSISLEASIRTCKVDQGWASRVESDRFLNPNLMVCPTWNGVDQYGRFVQPDSYFTKNAGCQSAEDRVLVENALRPMYAEYVTLDASGLAGAWDGATNFTNLYGQQNERIQANTIQNIARIGANSIPQGYASAIQSNCYGNAFMSQGDAKGAQNMAQRRMNTANSGFQSAQMKQRAGLY